ncbi:MAG: hypothetical protein WBB27_11705 [Maribacter sp.]
MPLNRRLLWWQLRFKPNPKLLNGYAILTVSYGIMDNNDIEKPGIQTEELHGMLRLAGVEKPERVICDYLERSGSLGMIETGTDNWGRHRIDTS